MKNRSLLNSAALLLMLSAGPACAALPWHSGDSPPAVAGVHLGESKEELLQASGEPSSTEKLGENGLAFTYDTREITVLWSPADGVAAIYLKSKEAGDIDGIRIGSARGEVVARWGTPSKLEGLVAAYVVDWWVIVVRLDNERNVTQLYIGRIAS